MFVTLGQIQDDAPCRSGWETLCSYLEVDSDDAPLDMEVKIRTILDSNGVEDACWAIALLPVEYAGKVRNLCCDFMEHFFEIWHHGQGEKEQAVFKETIEFARAFARGEIRVVKGGKRKLNKVLMGDCDEALLILEKLLLPDDEINAVAWDIISDIADYLAESDDDLVDQEEDYWTRRVTEFCDESD